MVLGYEEIITAPISTDSQCYCLQDNEVEALLAILEPVGWRTRWYSETEAEIDPLVTEQFASDLRSKLMNGCCGGESITTVIEHRVNPGTARLEISIDGGVTWTQDPADPAVQVVKLPAPVTGGISDTKCDAAVNGRGHVEDLVAAHDSAFDLATTVIGFVTAVAIFIATEIITAGAATAFLPIILPIMTAIFTLGKSAFDAYFTSDVYDEFQCIFYCRMKDDGSFDEAGYNAVLSDIGSKLPAGVQRDMLYRDFQAIGLDGLNNWCAYGVSTGGDCSACDCSPCAGIHIVFRDGGAGAQGILLSQEEVEDGWCLLTLTGVNTGSYFDCDFVIYATPGTYTGRGIAFDTEAAGDDSGSPGALYYGYLPTGTDYNAVSYPGNHASVYEVLFERTVASGNAIFTIKVKAH